MGRGLAMPEAAARPWIYPAGLPPEFHQIDDERHRSSEALRRMVAGMPRLDMRHNTFTKVVRQRDAAWQITSAYIEAFAARFGNHFRCQMTTRGSRLSNGAAHRARHAAFSHQSVIATIPAYETACYQAIETFGIEQAN